MEEKEEKEEGMCVFVPVGFPELTARLEKLAARCPKRPNDLPTTAHVADIVPRDLGERYIKKAKIGEGAFGSVSLAEDTCTGRAVVLKRIGSVMYNEEYGQAMQLTREAHLLQLVKHDNIVTLLDVNVEPSGDTVLIFEYCPYDLPGLLRHSPKLPVAVVKSLFRQMLVGLDHLHSHGVLHRDLKPANILIDKYGTLKICDMGWARYVAGPDVKPRAVAPPCLTWPPCTLFYRPPELLLGVKGMSYGSPVDVWAAGCILYEMLLGRPLFPGHTEVDALHAIFKVLGRPPAVGTRMPSAYDEVYRSYSYKPHLDTECQSSRVSANCARIFSRIFVFDPAKRPTVSELLRDPWLLSDLPAPCQRREIPLPEAPQFRFQQREIQNREKAGV